MPRKILVRTLIAGCGLLLAGCAAVPSQSQQALPGAAAAAAPARATVHFLGATDPQVAWMHGSKTMQWGLLFTHDDLVVMKEERAAGERPTLVNSPRYFEKEFLNRMATVKGIPNGEARTFEVEPGVYDWLVLIDLEGDGAMDGYLGTQAAQGPLASFEFLAGTQYFIGVDARGDLSFRIEPERPFYLALEDSVAERLPELEDGLLREYVELIVDEIDALRKTRGDLCYDLIQNEDREGMLRAYAALPPVLKVRESALVNRLLRAPREERATLAGDDAEAAMAPLARELKRVYGDDLEVLDDEELFAQNKDLGCGIHRDLLALTLLMPNEEAAPIWRYMFTEEDEDEDDDEPERAGPVTNT